MAIAATSVWEYRTSGAATNGGFYKSDAGTTDYSQQDAAQLSLTDIASDGAGTGISSVTGGFTAAMVGNGIHISGAGFTTGKYEITAYTDTNNITIDRSCGLSASGGTGNVGGALDLPLDYHIETFVAGNIVWVKVGTYTFTESINTAISGSIALPIKVKGYNATRGDNPTGANRPTFAMGTYSITVDDYWHYENIIMTSTSLYCLRADYATVLKNVKMENTSAIAGRDAYFGPACTTGLLFDSEFSSTSSAGGHGAEVGANNCILGCWFHDTDGDSTSVGLRLANGQNNNISFCIANRCSIGIELVQANNYIRNCTVDNNTTGIDGIVGAAYSVIGCQITNNTTGLIGDTAGAGTGNEFIDFNNWYGNGTDITTAVKGDNATANNPNYTDAANDDFENTGTTIVGINTTIGGSATDNNTIQGAWQRGDGGGETAYGCVG